MNEITDKFQTKEYKISRDMYTVHCALQYFITILVDDAFFAKILTSIGISDAVIGVISSLVTLAFLFQLMTLFFIRKIKNTKRTAIIFETVSQLLFCSFYIIPILPFSLEIKTVMVVLAVLFAYITRHIVSNIIYKWGNSYVSPDNRGEYSAVKEMFSLVSGIIFTLIAGYVIDKFEAIGDLNGGFLFISVAMLIIIALNFVSLMRIKGADDSVTENETKLSVKEIMKNVFYNRNFVNIIIMTVLWDVARCFSFGFMGTFKTKDLLLTVGTIQIINTFANIVRFFVSKPFGRYSDKTSFAKGLKLSYCIVALSYIAVMFTTKKTWWLVIVYTVLYNISLAGSNSNTYNVTYSYIKSEYFVPAMAIKSSIGGIFGFITSIFAGKILGYVQANGNTFMGIPMYGQQLLSFISLILITITILFIHFVIEKQKVIKQ